MPRLYLMKQGRGANPLFNNHWGLLISTRNPSESSPPTKENLSGTFLHVHGSVAAGFAFEAKRGWSQSTCPEPYRTFELGEVTPSSTQIATKDAATIPEPDEHEHGWILDPEPRTELERALLKAPPPQPSLRSSGANGAAGGAARARLQDCQEWIRMALPHAVDAGYLIYNEAIDVAELLSVHNQ